MIADEADWRFLGPEGRIVWHDGQLLAWPAGGGEPRTFPHPTSYADSYDHIYSWDYTPSWAVAPDGGCVAALREHYGSACRDDELRLWEPSSGRSVVRVTGRTTTLAFTPDSGTLVTGHVEYGPGGRSFEKVEVRLWAAPTGQPGRRWTAATEPLFDLVAGRDGLVVTRGQEAVYWFGEDGYQSVATPPLASPWGLALAPDQARLAVGARAVGVVICSRAGRLRILPFLAHHAVWLDCATLLLAHEDRLEMWDVERGQRLEAYQLPQPVLALHPDGILSRSRDELVWRGLKQQPDRRWVCPPGTVQFLEGRLMVAGRRYDLE